MARLGGFNSTIGLGNGLYTSLCLTGIDRRFITPKGCPEIFSGRINPLRQLRLSVPAVITIGQGEAELVRRAGYRRQRHLAPCKAKHSISYQKDLQALTRVCSVQQTIPG